MPRGHRLMTDAELPLWEPEVTGIQRIGKGAYADIWKAKTEGQTVARKRLLSNKGENDLPLVRNEVEALHVLRFNPYVPNVLGLESQRHPRDTLIRELVQGTRLSTLIAQGNLSAAQAIAISQRILNALSAAHCYGMVNGDMNPSNVITDPEAPEETKVVDWGPTYQDGADLFVRYYSHYYRSPEQLNFSTPLDCSPDVFSAGLVLCEMLTGPLEKTRRQRYAPRQIRTELEQRTQSLGRKIRDIILTATQLEPQDRYPHAGAMEKALGKVAG